MKQDAYVIDVYHKNKWIEINRTFKSKEQATKWGKWNFYKDKEMKNWRVKITNI